MATNPDVIYDSKQYKLRAGAPMPIGDPGGGEFITYTFMAEDIDIDVIAYTEIINESIDFRGQLGDLVNASFSRLSATNVEAYSGRREYTPTYIDEDDIGKT